MGTALQELVHRLGEGAPERLTAAPFVGDDTRERPDEPEDEHSSAYLPADDRGLRKCVGRGRKDSAHATQEESREHEDEAPWAMADVSAHEVGVGGDREERPRSRHGASASA